MNFNTLFKSSEDRYLNANRYDYYMIETLTAIEAIILNPFLLVFLLVLVFWELVWKGIALWKCGRNNQIVWFIFILLFNTVGILPILYLVFFQKSEESVKKTKPSKRK